MEISTKKFLYSTNGKILISIILGIGLASLFRKVCSKRNCIVFEAPSLEELKDQVYKYNDKCVKINSSAIKCDDKKKTVLFS
jgi:hypothetical protein